MGPSEPVPSFPQFRTITIEDKPLFDRHFISHEPQASEYTFANFFCWKSCDHSKITLANGNICILAEDREGETYFFEPLGGREIVPTVEICAQYLKGKGYKPVFSRLSEKFAAALKGNERYKVEHDRGNFDYLYRTRDLIELKGRKFDGKRNRIRKFLDAYGADHEFRKLETPDLKGCAALLERWKAEKTGLCIDDPIREALANYDKLKLRGSIVTVKGQIEAFTIGERLNSETAVIYIEVAESKYIGLPQYINRKFCEEWSDLEFINREQDLGDAGLRNAKLSYHPLRLVEKYSLTVKD